MSEYTHRFEERGNGFPSVGDDVIEDRGCGDIRVLNVVGMGSIQTQQWQPNWCYVTCEESGLDWDDLDGDEQGRLYESLPHVDPLGDEGEE